MNLLPERKCKLWVYNFRNLILLLKFYLIIRKHALYIACFTNIFGIISFALVKFRFYDIFRNPVFDIVEEQFSVYKPGYSKDIL